MVLQSGRRLLQDNSKLVQPGVRVTTKVQTTQQLATSVSQSIDNALQNTQIAQVSPMYLLLLMSPLSKKPPNLDPLEAAVTRKLSASTLYAGVQR